MNQRRSFLKSSAVLASVLGAPAIRTSAKTLPDAPVSPVSPNERVVRLYNTHTGESLRTIFWAEGEFIPDALQDINKLLRDHRNNKIAAIDPKLLVLLDRISAQYGNHPTMHVISGYRSPETNEMLHENTNGVAKHSLHMEAEAIDIRLPGVKTSQLRDAALALGRGGVGYYASSDFIHVDVGRVRRW